MGRYLLCYCQILFMIPNCIIVPGNRLCSCREEETTFVPIQKSVASCKWAKGDGDSASWIEVKVTNVAHDL